MAAGNTSISGLPLAGVLTGTELVPVVSNGVTSQTTVNAIRNLYITMGSILLDPNAGGAAMDLSTLSNPGVYTIMAEITIGQAVPVEIAYLSVVLGALSNHLPVAVIAATTTPSFHLSCVARVIGGTQYLRTFGLNNLAAVPLRFNYTVTFQPF